MNAKVSMDRGGRVVLPKPIRERFQLEPGESLEIGSFEDHIVLRPIRQHAIVRKELGMLVFDTGQPLSASDVRETIQNGSRRAKRQSVGNQAVKSLRIFSD